MLQYYICLGIYSVNGHFSIRVRVRVWYYSLSHDDVIHQRHRPGGKSRTNPAVRAGKVTSAPNTSIYGYIN